MKSTAITEAMIRDHGKIIDLFIRFRKSNDLDKHTMTKSFNEFVWELEKHFFTEEKAIFTAYEPEDETKGYDLFMKWSETVSEFPEVGINDRKH